MTSYQAYIDRVSAIGGNFQESIKSVTKKNNHDLIMNSPSKDEVYLNDDETIKHYAILSDLSYLDGYKKRRALFVPDTNVNIGDYVEVIKNGLKYLATNQNKNDINPELILELCNEMFVIEKGGKVQTGKDDFGRPIYTTTIDAKIEIPCVLTTNMYNIIDNSPIPLPEGTILIKIQYKKENIPDINYVFKYRNMNYKVTAVNYEYVINNIGYLEIRMQRMT